MKTGVSKKDNDKPQMMATPNTDSQKSWITTNTDFV